METNDSKELIQLHLLGISTSQIREGAFALILAETNGKRRIPVVIGVAEAQSIAMWFENIKPPRPLTHDLFAAYIKKNNAIVRNVLIYKFEDFVFFARICISSPNRDDILLDSRTSDAIALAIRCGAPIFATPEVVETAGYIMNEDADEESSTPQPTAADIDIRVETRETSIEDMEEELQNLIDSEEYEKAAELKKLIDKRRNKRE